MKMTRINKRLLLVACFVAASGIFAACGGGSTGNSGPVSEQLVSNGGAGSRITIELDDGGNEIPTAQTVHFKVTAIDPKGAPLVNIRIFCESERGIAIIEPSSGGVAFEHTGSSGVMSGYLGGLTPGSFLLECRGPQGFNLVARKSFKVVGDIPPGFTGWPGAAGGNLGGGVVVTDPSASVVINQITFTTVVAENTRTADIDLSAISDCDGDTSTIDPEPYTVDNFNVEMNNGSLSSVFVESIEVVLYRGSAIFDRGIVQLGGIVIPPQSESTFTNGFTSFATKTLFGGSVAIERGDYNVVFTINYTDGQGQSGSVSQAAAIRADNFNNC